MILCSRSKPGATVNEVKLRKKKEVRGVEMARKGSVEGIFRRLRGNDVEGYAREQESGFAVTEGMKVI